MKKITLIFSAMLLAFATGCSDSSDNDECTPMDTRCENGIFQVCNNGWISSACPDTQVCTVINGKAQCAAAETCTSGATRCNGTALESCNGTTWTAIPCAGTCVENNGQASCQTDTGSCTSGATRCNGNSLESCNGTNWTILPCAGTCVENNGQASCQTAPETCTSGATRCNGNALESCNGTNWTTTSCDGTCVENNGQASCVKDTPTVTCTKGQTKCQDDGTQATLLTCDESGNWVKTPCPDSTIEGARLTCKNADSCSTVICNEGTFYNSEANTCQEYAHSNACKAGRTYCNGKTNFLYECLETSNESPLLATDCSKDGKVCVKIDDDTAQCMDEECNGHFCEGEVLHYCTEDHKIDTELGTMDCTESDRICDIGEFGYAECLYPECTNEGETRCVDDDETKVKTCTNKRWVESACPSGTCSNGICK